MEELIHLLYYLEITGDPYNLIGSQQCDLFTNHTIFSLNQVCSRSRHSCSKSYIFVLNRIISASNAKCDEKALLFTLFNKPAT